MYAYLNRALPRLVPIIGLSLLWVSGSPAQAAERDVCLSGCPYTSIQAAVNAAQPGDTIEVQQGTYAEQVTINKNLKVHGQGAGSTTIQAPATLVADDNSINIVEVKQGAKVTLWDLTVAGPGPGPCASLDTGIAVIGGATLEVYRASVVNIQDTPFGGCPSDRSGEGIRIGTQRKGTSVQVGNASIHDVSITGYQKDGITIAGAGSNAEVYNATVTGAGTQTKLAQNGILVIDGAVAQIHDNDVSKNLCNDFTEGCGPDLINQFQSIGIGTLSAGNGTVIKFNRVHENDDGIYNLANKTQIAGNQVTNNRYAGVVLDAGDASLNGNTITNPNASGVVLLSFDGGTSAVGTLSCNLISGNDTGILLSQLPGATAPPRLVAHLNQIAGNRLYGLNNTTLQNADARSDYWGDPRGPSTVSTPNRGDRVMGPVTYKPFLHRMSDQNAAECFADDQEHPEHHEDENHGHDHQSGDPDDDQ